MMNCRIRRALIRQFATGTELRSAEGIPDRNQSSPSSYFSKTGSIRKVESQAIRPGVKKTDRTFLKKSSFLSLNGSTSSKSLDLLCRIGKILSL